MKTEYAVLNDKLFPVDVAELLLNEGLGSIIASVQITIEPNDDKNIFLLNDLLLQASQSKIDHSFNHKNISDMLLKLINNNNISGDIIIKIVKGNKIFLHMYFIQNCLYQ